MLCLLIARTRAYAPRARRTVQAEKERFMQVMDAEVKVTKKVVELDELSLPELKMKVKELGGKPRNLRKHELKLELGQLLGRSLSTGVELLTPEDKNDDKANVCIIPATFDQLIAHKTPITSSTSAPESVSSVQIANTTSSSEGVDGEGVEIVRWQSKVKKLSPHNANSLTSDQSAPRPVSSSSSGSDRCYSYHQKFPTGPERNSRLKAVSDSADMELTFLGTASCTPSTSRGVSCVAFRSTSQMWLFDCGESTQLQLQKSCLKASRVNKIFITHTHGDHLFGLAGVLCMLGQASMEARRTGDASDPVEIYGPEGIRNYLRSVISLSYSRIVIPHRIHEIKDVPYLHGHFARRPVSDNNIQTQYSASYGEIRGGRDIYPDSNVRSYILT